MGSASAGYHPSWRRPALPATLDMEQRALLAVSTAPHSRVALELPLCGVITSGRGGSCYGTGAPARCCAAAAPRRLRWCYAGRAGRGGGGSGMQQTVAVRQMTCEVAPPQRAPRSVRRATPPELRPAADLRLVS